MMTMSGLWRCQGARITQLGQLYPLKWHGNAAHPKRQCHVGAERFQLRTPLTSHHPCNLFPDIPRTFSSLSSCVHMCQVSSGHQQSHSAHHEAVPQEAVPVELSRAPPDERRCLRSMLASVSPSEAEPRRRGLASPSQQLRVRRCLHSGLLQRPAATRKHTAVVSLEELSEAQIVWAVDAMDEHLPVWDSAARRRVADDRNG